MVMNGIPSLRRLNGVRPRRPEQSVPRRPGECATLATGLNGVRPRRPEQFTGLDSSCRHLIRLNGVRPRRPEQLSSSCESGPGDASLNGVRPRRPEQCDPRLAWAEWSVEVSMESGLEDRNNRCSAYSRSASIMPSQWSPA